MDDEARDQLLQNLESRTARIEQFLPTLPTRAEMHIAIREEGEQTRHQMEVLFESLRDDIRIIAEGHAGLTSRVVSLEGRVERDIGALDLRVTAIEHRAEP